MAEDAREETYRPYRALALASALLFWLVTEHWRHLGGLFAILPYLLFLSCPLMHLFMHHGRGHESRDRMQSAPPTASNQLDSWHSSRKADVPRVR